ncbi:MAG: butyrate kinase [Coriobacteriales bacterium]|nr:butyrate kinase [Coriobacteriales bacterium]
MSYRILTLSPGSTSTKVAVFEAEAQGEPQAVFKANVRHDPSELAQFDQAAEQLQYRIDTILRELEGANVELSSIDAFSGYCGGMGPTKGGIFAIDETVCNSVLNCGMNHPAILGAPILLDFAKRCGKPAYAVNQPDTDELADVARITGYPGVYRKSHVHCLNQKEVAIRFAGELGMAYEEGNFIVAHVGGGLSVAAHEHGSMVDANDVLEGSGPMAPNRSGDVPARPVAQLCFSGDYDKRGMLNVIGKTGGLKGLVGTDDTLEIEKRISEGDEWAHLCLDAMAYQTAKAIGGFAATLCGKVDGIVLTGGVSNDPYFVDYITQRVGWIAPVRAYGGDFEMEALAAGAVRALAGTEEVMTYTGKPSWTGFDLPGAFVDVEA